MEDELRDLYSHDSDWNILLPMISKKVNQEQQDLWEFLEGFKKFPDEIPLQNIKTPLSTLIYRTECDDWNPENFNAGIDGISTAEQVYYDINDKEKTLVVVTGQRTQVAWGDVQNLFELNWEIFVVFWDKKQNLLFIHSSANKLYLKLAKAITNLETTSLYDINIFRAFHGIDRLKLNNVGLKQQVGKLISFIMRMGQDVKLGMSEVEKSGGKLTNIFGVGFNEIGRKVSIGASLKGRIWSMRSNNLKVLTNWCSYIGSKVIDSSIDPVEVLKGTLVPEVITVRPSETAFYIDWPESFYYQSEIKFSFRFKDYKDFYLYDLNIELVNYEASNPLLFKIFNEYFTVSYELELLENDKAGFRFFCKDNEELKVMSGKSELLASDFFYDYPPVFWFVDGSSLEGNEYTKLKKVAEPYPRDKIEVWSWKGVDIKKESQKSEKRKDSIQYRVIENLMEEDYDVIFDDDSAGELADVVTIKDSQDSIEVGFYHCKYSSEVKPGSRTNDLYVVCGQAQRSVNWMAESNRIFSHLIRREVLRGEKSRFERGTINELETLKVKARFKPISLKVYVVQPGLSRKVASIDQLTLISVADNYLKETYKVPFHFIASE